MSFVSKEKTAPATWKISAAIAAEEFAKKVDEIFAKELKNITLPGFRKGKAPRAMVEKRYGESLFFEDALDALLPAAVQTAIEGSQLDTCLSPADLEVQEMEKAAGVQFSFTVFAKPEYTVENYRGLEAAVPSAEVTQADIDARIEELRQRNARQVEVTDRPAQDGDAALIDFKGILDGVAFPGGSAENHELVLGSGSFIPGFEEQIVGHTPGESFDVNVTFPAEYHAEELAGKPVVFEVKLHALKADELPALDDDFAQEVGEDYNTVADLRQGIEEELKKSKADEADAAFEKALQEKLADLPEGEIPEALYAERTQRNIEMFFDRIQIPMERYLELVGEGEAEFRARMGEQSEAQVKQELALEKIAELEGIAPAEEEIDAEYARLAEQYNVPLERVKYAVPAEEITKDLNREKAMALVKEAAVKVTE